MFQQYIYETPQILSRGGGHRRKRTAPKPEQGSQTSIEVALSKMSGDGKSRLPSAFFSSLDYWEQF